MHTTLEKFINEHGSELGALGKLNFTTWLQATDHTAPVSSNLPAHNIPFQRWYRFKEAFSPLMVLESLMGLDFWPSTCLDCFGGSGTTALTSQFLGINPTTIEVNPFLADLIEAKLSTYDRHLLLDDYCEVIERATDVRIDLRAIRYAAWPATMVEPGVKGRWLYPRETFRKILALREAIEAVADVVNRRLLRVLLGSILVDMSNVVISGKGRRYRGGWQASQKKPSDVMDAFQTAFKDAQYDITAHGHRQTSEYTLLRGDSRQRVTEIGPCDVALFSPPYPNSFDYTDVYNVELWVLGYLNSRQDNTALRTSTLRSHVQVTRDMGWDHLNSKHLKDTVASLRKEKDRLWDKDLPEMIGAYFADLDTILRGIRPKLNANGALLMTVGDSRYADVLVDVGEILKELAPAAGYVCDSITPIRAMKTSAQQGGAASLSEDLVRLRPA